MKTVIEYLNTLMNNLEIQRTDKESLMNSKIIEANEIHKTISKLTLNDNDTHNVFSASGTKIEFHNMEISNLKKREGELRAEADSLADEIKDINNQIEELAVTIAHANSSKIKLDNLSNEVIRLNGEVAMYATGGKKYIPSNEQTVTENNADSENNGILSKDVEDLDINMDSNAFLKEIADRAYFISRILKFDPIRVKLELDEIYRSINKYINK